MAEVTATLVKELRDKTGAGMMDCKRALGDTEATSRPRSTGCARKARRRGEESGGSPRKGLSGRDARPRRRPSRSIPKRISSRATSCSRPSCAPSAARARAEAMSKR